MRGDIRTRYRCRRFVEIDTNLWRSIRDIVVSVLAAYEEPSEASGSCFDKIPRVECVSVGFDSHPSTMVFGRSAGETRTRSCDRVCVRSL